MKTTYKNLFAIVSLLCWEKKSAFGCQGSPCDKRFLACCKRKMKQSPLGMTPSNTMLTKWFCRFMRDRFIACQMSDTLQAKLIAKGLDTKANKQKSYYEMLWSLPRHLKQSSSWTSLCELLGTQQEQLNFMSKQEQSSQCFWCGANINSPVNNTAWCFLKKCGKFGIT